MPERQISVIMPSYNQGAMIRGAIESVLCQTYSKWELWIVDNCSSDGTGDVLREYENDPRITAIVEPDQGQSDALNKGLAHATGEVIGILNADDRYEPATLELVNGQFDVSDCDVVYGDALKVNPLGERWWYYQAGVPDLQDLVIRGYSTIPHPSTFYHRSAGVRFDDDLDYSMDYDLLLRLLDGGARFSYLARPLSRMTVHPEMKSIRSFAAQVEESFRAAGAFTGGLGMTGRLRRKVQHVRAKMRVCWLGLGREK